MPDCTRRGFTLIETLVVMAVVALLLSVALPRYFGAVDRSKQTVLSENLRVLRLSLDRYHADKGRHPDRLNDLVEHKYLRAVPVDPITQSADTWITVAPAESSGGGIADVKSGAPGLSIDGRPYESY